MEDIRIDSHSVQHLNLFLRGGYVKSLPINSIGKFHLTDEVIQKEVQHALEV